VATNILLPSSGPSSALKIKAVCSYETFIQVYMASQPRSHHGHRRIRQNSKEFKENLLPYAIADFWAYVSVIIRYFRYAESFNTLFQTLAS
jgi:hypothetical protein